MAKAGITGCAAYLPPTRLARAAILAAHEWAVPALEPLARAHKAVGGWDEDALTMAVEAARACLAGADATPGSLLLASTSLPFADRQNSGIVAAALDLPDGVEAADLGGSQRAGTAALLQALSSPNTTPRLVVAGEKRRPKPASRLEMTAGDGAAALTVGEGAPLAEPLAHASLRADLVDHYRAADADFDYVFEERWLRDEGYYKIVPEAVRRALERAGLQPEKVDHFLFPCDSARLAGRVAERCGIPPERARDPLFEGCGHTGAAHPLLMLVHALEEAAPGEILLLLAFGQGCDAILLRAGERAGAAAIPAGVNAALAAGRAEERYSRYLAQNDLLEMDWGVRAERDDRTAQPTAYRKARELYGFLGGRCERCGTLQFPRSHACANPNCRALDTQRLERLAERSGRIKSYTEDWLAHTPDPPLRYGNVAFAGGANVLMELTDFPPGEIRVGQPVRNVFRIKDIDRRRNFRRYFWKAAPDGAAREAG